MNIVFLLACNNNSFSTLSQSTEHPQDVPNWELLLTGNISGEYEPCG